MSISSVLLQALRNNIMRWLSAAFFSLLPRTGRNGSLFSISPILYYISLLYSLECELATAKPFSPRIFIPAPSGFVTGNLAGLLLLLISETEPIKGLKKAGRKKVFPG